MTSNPPNPMKPTPISASTAPQLSDSAPEVLRRYYAILTGGADDYGDGTALLELLDDQLDFEGPIAGQVIGAEMFIEGVKGFVATVSRIDVVQDVHDAAGSSVLYDAHLPHAVVRMSEFFRFEGGRLARLKLQYPPQEYIEAGGR